MTEQELMDVLDALQHHPSFCFLRSSSSHKTITSSSVRQPYNTTYQWLKISNIFQYLSIVTLSIATSSSSNASATVSLGVDGLQQVPPPATSTSSRRSTRRNISNRSHDPKHHNHDHNSSSSSSSSTPTVSNPSSSLMLVARSISASIVPAFVPLPVGVVLAVLLFWVPFPDWYTTKHTHILLMYTPSTPSLLNLSTCNTSS